MMKQVVVIPAYNEEEHISRTLLSLIEQDIQPTLIVVVDDGSQDRTFDLVSSLSTQHPFIKIISGQKEKGHDIGSKIVDAFNVALHTFDLNEFDLISKFDADLQFESNYIGNVQNYFKKDPELGLMGGICTVLNDKQNWVSEKASKGDHVRGALKTYRVKAFQSIGGLRSSMGWDTADEFHLRYAGWKVGCDPTLLVKHFRVTNTGSGWMKASQKNGHVFYKLRYGLILSFFSSFKRGLKFKPYLLTGLVSFFSYLKQYFSNTERLMSKDQGKFVRKYRFKTWLKK